jgi:Glycosyl hydrolase family 79 C-terminal beta domain
MGQDDDRMKTLLRSLAGVSVFLSLGCGNSGGSGGAPDASRDTKASDATPDAAQHDAAPRDAASEAMVDAGPFVPASITVDPKTTLGTIGAGFVGLSYEKNKLQGGYFRGNNTALIAMVDLLGPSLLRVGGNSVDDTVWETSDAGTPMGDGAAPSFITPADVDALAAFAKAANWKVLYGVNMKTSSPALAEDESRYAAGQLGSSLYGFEIGNEPDLYTTVVSSPGTFTYAAYLKDWASFAAAIHAGTPGAPMTGPAAAYNYPVWTVPFAKDEASAIILLTQHYYVANGQAATSTIELLLSPNPGLVTELDAVSAAATSNAIPNGYRLSECNSFYNGGAPNVSDAYGTALWGIDFLFTNALNGSSGANFHGGGDGPGYTPIADSDGMVVGARPLFYGMLLVARAGQGKALKVTGAPTSINLSAYAIGNSGTVTSVVLSNKDTTTSVHAVVDAGSTVSSAGALRLAGPALDATTGVTLGGVSIGADGSFTPGAPEVLSTSGTTFEVDVPPASAVLVSVK